MNERLLAIWQRMLEVCCDETHADYAVYGAMGIGVCEAWRHDAAAFTAWAEGHHYADDLFLIRIHIHGDFQPENCWWVDEKVYQRYLQFIRPIAGESAVRPLGDWLTDPRCRVDLSTFTRLLTKGWSVERILTQPPDVRHRGRKYPFAYAAIPIGMLFGRLTVTGAPDTAYSPSGWKHYVYPCRCSCGTPEHRVYANNLLNGEVVSCGCYLREQQGRRSLVHGDARSSGMSRLYSIWTRMIYVCTRPKQKGYSIYGGRGITVCLAWQMEYAAFRRWALDHGYQDGLRIERFDRAGDFTPENCFFTDEPPLTSRSRIMTLYGESKTLAEWARDPRCRVSEQSFSMRIANGWTLEDALFVAQRRTSAPRLVTAFGETRSLAEWGRDARCQVLTASLQSRLDAGWDAETAISTPSGGTRPTMAAFGERKTMAAWLRDPRCVVSEKRLYARLAQGWTAEKALSHPLIAPNQLYEAFGERKTIAAWGRDPRCAVGTLTLRGRLSKGWGAEEAISTPAAPQSKSMEAFGERKNMTQWAKDARCRVPFTTLYSRLKTGWSLEDALTTPADKRGRRSSP